MQFDTIFFSAISKHFRKKKQISKKKNWYNAKDKCEDYILAVFEDLFFWLCNNFSNLKIYKSINEINFLLNKFISSKWWINYDFIKKYSFIEKELFLNKVYFLFYQIKTKLK